jgi:preprotein translocase subunit SecE
VLETTDEAIDVEAVETAARPPAKQSAPSQKSTASKSAQASNEAAWYDRFVNLDRFEGVRRFIRESWSEIQKVIWPDRETTRNLTLVVIAVSIVLGILLGGIDYVLFQLFEALP